MKKIALLAIVSLSLIAMITNVAQAQNFPSYAVLKAGVYAPQHDDLDGFDDVFNGEAAFGAYISENLALEVGIDWFKTDSTVSAGTTKTKVDIETLSVFLLSLKGFYPIGNFEPYLFGGVGYYSVQGDIDIKGPGISGSGSDMVNALGWHLGLGANYNITPRIFVGAEAKYLWAEPELEMGTNKVNQVNIDGLITTANVGYRF